MNFNRSKIKEYRESTYDGTWWIHFTNDHPPYFYGVNPPNQSKYPIVHTKREFGLVSCTNSSLTFNIK